VAFGGSGECRAAAGTAGAANLHHRALFQRRRPAPARMPRRLRRSRHDDRTAHRVPLSLSVL